MEQITKTECAAIFKALEEFIARRSGLDSRDYWTSDHWNARSEGRAAFRADQRQVAKDGVRARQALELARRLQPAKPELLADAFRAFSGRLEWDATARDTSGSQPNPHLVYTTGQYFPTEYRKAAASVLETYISAWRQWYASEHPQEFTFADMSDVISANKQVGGHWFERSTMRFFKTKIESRLIAGKRFITSERGPNDARKRYTIREAKPDGSIDTIGEFQQFSTLAQARANVLMNRAEGN
jgi:hypothetical protein